MKKNLIYLLFSVTLLCAALTACSDNDDLDSTSVVRPTTTEQNDLDRWLKRNYVETYNIQLKYRFEDIESSMGYYLTPASYKQSVAMAKLVRHMCLEAYDEITGQHGFHQGLFPENPLPGRLVCLQDQRSDGAGNGRSRGEDHALQPRQPEPQDRQCEDGLFQDDPPRIRAYPQSDETLPHRFLRRFPARITYRTNASKSTRPPNRHCKKDSFPRMHRKPTARISWNSSPPTSTGAQKSGRRC